MTESYAIGPLVINVQDKGTELFNREMGHCSVDYNKNPDMHVFFDKDPVEQISSTYFAGEKLEFNKSDILIKDSKGTYSIINLMSDSTTEIYINFKHFDLGDNIKRLYNIIFGSYKSPLERKHQAIMKYGFFWWIVQVELLKKKGSFIHAFIFGNDKEATAITGTGGAGKTGTGLQLVKSSSYKYLSDDFGIVDRNGSCYISPRKITVYANELSDKYTEKGLLDNFSKLNRLNWQLQSGLGNNPKRRIRPDTLLSSNRLQRCSPLKKVIYIRRTATPETEIINTTREKIISMINDASQRELNRFIKILYTIKSISHGETNFPTPTKFYKQMEKVYHNILPKSNLYLVDTNTETTPEELSRLIKNI